MMAAPVRGSAPSPVLRATHRRACRYDQTGPAEWIASWGGSYFADIARLSRSVMAIVSLWTFAGGDADAARAALHTFLSRTVPTSTILIIAPVPVTPMLITAVTRPPSTITL